MKSRETSLESPSDSSTFAGSSLPTPIGWLSRPWAGTWAGLALSSRLPAKHYRNQCILIHKCQNLYKLQANLAKKATLQSNSVITLHDHLCYQIFGIILIASDGLKCAGRCEILVRTFCPRSPHVLPTFPTRDLTNPQIAGFNPETIPC